MACNNNCQECNPCNETPCVQESCACAVFLDDTCITTTEDMPYTGITKNKTLNEWILALDEYLQNKFTSIENFFKLKNVGLGAKVYKGISILGEKEIRSLTSEDNSVIITENENSIDFSATEGLIPPFEVLYPGIYDSIVIRDRDEDNYGEPGFRCIDFSKADAPPIDPDPPYEYGAKAWYSTILNGLNQRIGTNAEGAIIGGGDGNSIYNGRYSGIFCGASNVINSSGGSVNGCFIGSGTSNNISMSDSSGTSAILSGNDCSVLAPYAVIINGDSNTIQATGTNSFIGTGIINIISSQDSFIGAGFQNKTSGAFSTVLNGSECEAKGVASIVLNGGANIADSYSEISGGTYGTTYTPVSRTAFNIADRIFNIGIGTGDLDRKDGISLFKNGVATLPTVTNALITAASGKSVITKEYLLSQLALLPTLDGSETKVTAGTNTTITGNGTIATPYVVNSTVTGTPQGIQDTIDTNNLINQAEIEIALNGGLYVYAIPPSTEIYGTLLTQYGSQSPNVVTAFIGTESSLGKSTLTFYTNKTQFIDSRFNKGIENGGDYEANFTARSLITKQYFESETNKQKVIPAGSYALTDADNNYTIFIDNGATAMTISLGAITIPNFCVGFIQKGTADVTFSGVTNPIGLKSKGQGYQTFIERELSTSNYYLLGNTKV